jgi:two-component system, OmpR family, response regulator
MAKRQILLVDDDRTLSPLLKEYLEAKDFDCSLCHNGFEALEVFKNKKYDLCVLDIKMPFKNGLELALDFKNLEPDIPFLFLTGQAEKEDRIKGLELGADDYIIKPYSMQEVFLRIKTIFKRVEIAEKRENKTESFRIGGYTFLPATRELTIGDDVFRLSEIESKLLLVFCQSRDGVILRDQTLKFIWPEENLYRERSLNVYVSKLRSYLKADSSIEILNIHGTGYKLIVK